MKRNNKKVFIIIALLICTVFMGIGYAFISQTLNIEESIDFEGQWNIYISNIEAVEEYGKAKSRDAKVESDKLSASFVVDLFSAGDYVIYNVTVKNDGNINARLNTIIPIITNASPYISMINSIETENRLGEILEAGHEMTFTVKIAVNGSNEDLEDVEGSKYKLRLNFLQD